MKCYICQREVNPPVGAIDGRTDGRGNFSPVTQGKCIYYVCPDCLRLRHKEPKARRPAGFVKAAVRGWPPVVGWYLPVEIENNDILTPLEPVDEETNGAP